MGMGFQKYNWKAKNDWKPKVHKKGTLHYSAGGKKYLNKFTQTHTHTHAASQLEYLIFSLF